MKSPSFQHLSSRICLIPTIWRLIYGLGCVVRLPTKNQSHIRHQPPNLTHIVSINTIPRKYHIWGIYDRLSYCSKSSPLYRNISYTYILTRSIIFLVHFILHHLHIPHNAPKFHSGGIRSSPIISHAISLQFQLELIPPRMRSLMNALSCHIHYISPSHQTAHFRFSHPCSETL